MAPWYGMLVAGRQGVASGQWCTNVNVNQRPVGTSFATLRTFPRLTFSSCVSPHEALAQLTNEGQFYRDVGRRMVAGSRRYQSVALLGSSEVEQFSGAK